VLSLFNFFIINKSISIVYFVKSDIPIYQVGIKTSALAASTNCFEEILNVSNQNQPSDWKELKEQLPKKPH